MNDETQAKPVAEAIAHAEQGSRRAYAAPTLRRLGSVRELTFGSTGTVVDGAFTRRHTPM